MQQIVWWGNVHDLETPDTRTETWFRNIEYQDNFLLNILHLIRKTVINRLNMNITDNKIDSYFSNALYIINFTRTSNYSTG